MRASIVSQNLTPSQRVSPTEILTAILNSTAQTVANITTLTTHRLITNTVAELTVNARTVHAHLVTSALRAAAVKDVAAVVAVAAAAKAELTFEKPQTLVNAHLNDRPDSYLCIIGTLFIN